MTHAVPIREVEAFLIELSKMSIYSSREEVALEYRIAGCQVIEDAFSSDIAMRVSAALLSRTPLSVIRIGDGEANILSYGDNPETPVLDGLSARSIISMQEDTFKASNLWLLVLKHLMHEAILFADIVGVRGIWHWGVVDEQPSNKEYWFKPLQVAPRANSGVVRAETKMLEMAKKGLLKGKVIASAHFYYSILEHLDQLIGVASSIIIVTSNDSLKDAFVRRYPGKDIKVVLVGEAKTNVSCRHGSHPTQAKRPLFLLRFNKALPSDLHGVLCLIGAGPWAEYYCSMVKKHGGVAVDVGSGLDLLVGIKTRPIHATVTDKSYSIL